MGRGGVCGGFVVKQGSEKGKPNERVNLWRNEESIHLKESFGLVFGLQVLRKQLQLRPGDKVAIWVWWDWVVWISKLEVPICPLVSGTKSLRHVLVENVQKGEKARGFPGNPQRTIVYGTLGYHLSLPGLLGQVRIRGRWREVEWQKASVLELVGLVKKRVERTEEEREREREVNIPWGTWKTNNALNTGFVRLTKAQSVLLRRSWKTRWESELGRFPRSKELAVKNENENEREPQPSGFWHQKCKVKELENVRFRERMRPMLYRNRSPLIRREGAAVRLWTAALG